MELALTLIRGYMGRPMESGQWPTTLVGALGPVISCEKPPIEDYLSKMPPDILNQICALLGPKSTFALAQTTAKINRQMKLVPLYKGLLAARGARKSVMCGAVLLGDVSTVKFLIDHTQSYTSTLYDMLTWVIKHDQYLAFNSLIHSLPKVTKAPSIEEGANLMMAVYGSNEEICINLSWLDDVVGVDIIDIRMIVSMAVRNDGVRALRELKDAGYHIKDYICEMMAYVFEQQSISVLIWVNQVFPDFEIGLDEGDCSLWIDDMLEYSNGANNLALEWLCMNSTGILGATIFEKANCLLGKLKHNERLKIAQLWNDLTGETIDMDCGLTHLIMNQRHTRQYFHLFIRAVDHRYEVQNCQWTLADAEGYIE